MDRKRGLSSGREPRAGDDDYLRDRAWSPRALFVRLQGVHLYKLFYTCARRSLRNTSLKRKTGNVRHFGLAGIGFFDEPSPSRGLSATFSKPRSQ